MDQVCIERGDWVVADDDCGRVSEVLSEDTVRVFWESGVETPCATDSIEGVYTSRTAALAAVHQ